MSLAQSLQCWCVLLLCVCSAARSDSMCSSGVKYLEQPPSLLPCNPLPGAIITLRCTVQGPNTTELVKWYRALNQEETPMAITNAVKGLVLVDGIPEVFATLSISVSDAGYGFYWCGIDGFSSSTVTPICPLFLNTSAPDCNNDVLTSQVEQCAVSTSTDDTFLPNITGECLPPSPSPVPLSPSTNAPSVAIASSIVSAIAKQPSTTPAVTQTSSVIKTTNSVYLSITKSSFSSSLLLASSSLTSSSSSLFASSSSVATTSEPVSVLLVVLIVVCVLLACVATMIIMAITILCYLTRRGSPKCDDEGSKPPTIDPNSDSDGFYTSIFQNGHKERESHLDDNDVPVRQREHAVSFSNPVYEISSTATVQVPPPTVIKEPPQPLSPVEGFSSTPPIFSNNDEEKSNSGRRSYYAKPDLSKKRSRSQTASSSQENDTPPPMPPSYLNSHVSRDSIKDVVYDTPSLQRVLSHSENKSPVNGKQVPLSSEYSYADYDDPEDAKLDSSPPVAVPLPSSHPTAPSHKGGGGGVSEANYDDPWETLPSAIKRSRESTRSHSNQPTMAATGNGSIPSNQNNNNTASLFDDPAYDIPSCDIVKRT